MSLTPQLKSYDAETNQKRLYPSSRYLVLLFKKINKALQIEANTTQTIPTCIARSPPPYVANLPRDEIYIYGKFVCRLKSQADSALFQDLFKLGPFLRILFLDLERQSKTQRGRLARAVTLRRICHLLVRSRLVVRKDCAFRTVLLIRGGEKDVPKVLSCR
jgi:hypothetical protein